MTPPLRTWLRALVPLALYAALIYTLSAQPGFTANLPRFANADKWAHVVEYGGFGFLAARAVRVLAPRSPAFAAGVAILAGAGYGATDELHQFFVPGRDSDPWDVVADTLGSTLGAAAYLAFARLRVRRRQREAQLGESPHP